MEQGNNIRFLHVGSTLECTVRRAGSVPEDSPERKCWPKDLVSPGAGTPIQFISWNKNKKHPKQLQRMSWRMDDDQYKSEGFLKRNRTERRAKTFEFVRCWIEISSQKPLTVVWIISQKWWWMISKFIWIAQRIRSHCSCHTVYDITQRCHCIDPIVRLDIQWGQRNIVPRTS